jgi:dGTPase
VKHSTRYDRPRVADFNASEAPPLEAQIVDLADEIAYNAHDIDDGLQSGMLSLEDLEGVALWDESYAEAARICPNASETILRYQSVRRILDALVRDLITTIEARIERESIRTIGDVRRVMPCISSLSDDMDAKLRALKVRLMDRLYRHQRVRRMGAKARRVMTGIFEAYMEDPGQMPPHVVARVSADTPMPRVIADYIAGMTDRFALEEYSKLYDPWERV